jgi:glucose/arabinose dehydrogenase
MRKTFLIGLAVGALASPVAAAELTGTTAFGGWKDDAPGVVRLITAADLPAPGATESAANESSVVERPADLIPKVPDGFQATLFASGLKVPRVIRVAPNGDIFVAESGAGRVLAFRAAAGAAKPTMTVFATGFDYPYGIAFPPGPDPRWVYVASTAKVVRFPYKAGDVKAGGPAETVIEHIPTAGHNTRDIAFSADGKILYLTIGSATNVGEDLPKKEPSSAREFEADTMLGATWGPEDGRADVLAFDPEPGRGGKLFATGIRNCSGLAIEPVSGLPWCATNERDGLGDNVPPDYVTHIAEGAFYGWPWYYIGDHEDPRHKGERPDLPGKITVPDVLIQAHSAPLGLTFYQGDAFPPEYKGDGFVTLHGSWNRGLRTGYKVVRILMDHGKATGKYEDFMTGFVLSDSDVWGRPVGVAVAHDGALLVSEDGNGTIWRVAPKK